MGDCIGTVGNHNQLSPARLWNAAGPFYVTSCAGGRHNMPRPLQVDLWSFDLESGVRITYDVGYLCANFSLPRPLCSRVRPDVRDRRTDVRQTDRRQTSDAHHRLMSPTLGAGHNKQRCSKHPDAYLCNSVTFVTSYLCVTCIGESHWEARWHLSSCWTCSSRSQQSLRATVRLLLRIAHFYRATLCLSAVLAIGRCLSVSLSVCLSVYLSVHHTRVLHSNG